MEETIKMWGIKCNFSKEDLRGLKKQVKRIREALKETRSGVVMEGESVDVPWFYLMFRSRAERDAFHKSHKGTFGNVKLTRVYGAPADIPIKFFTPAYLMEKTA